MKEKLDQLQQLLAELADLDKIGALLSWDRETYMPPGGNEDRAGQIATLARIRHARITSDEFGKLLDDLQSHAAGLDPDSHEARMVRLAKRDFDQMSKLPEKLVVEITRATSAALPAWQKARHDADFAHFAPYLERNIELNRERAEVMGYESDPYDALVDPYEPGMTAARLQTIFAELREAIVPMVREIAERGDVADDSCLWQAYDHDAQLRFGLDIAERLGYDTQRGRLDLTAHPFCTSFGVGDVRITTRVMPDFLNSSLFAIMHEAGHAMYEQGGDPTFAHTSAFSGASAGVHELQSRLWENLVGRSRAFTRYLFPRLQQEFPQQLGNVSEDGFYRAINKVQPSFIRVEADEVTYNLHIMLRFELENMMLGGKLAVRDLEEAWNERFREYLGLTPPDSSQGVLQDIHWSDAASFGIFPGYTLGNVIGAQLFVTAREEMPDLDAQLEKGECRELLTWLQTNLYRHGRKFTPDELVERITGKPLGTEAWVSYVKGKFGEIYAL